MPSKTQELSFPGQTTEQLLLLAYGTFLELNWTPKYAGPTALIGYTPRSWNKYDDEISIEANDGALKITSSLVHNESFDMLGKNKKHINEFITAFEKTKARGIQESWNDAFEKLKQQTIEAANQYEQQAEEIDKVMHLSTSKLYVTYAIILINVIVFILMAIQGAGIFEANGYTQVKWGSNYSPLTLSGDWWRLISCMFIHFGIIHLLLNSYGLYIVGTFLEPMLGKAKFILAYFCTGVLASLASLWWHDEGINSAGASGAIFGMFGVFLALLITNLIPKQTRASLLRGIGIIVAINLIYGMKKGVDNAAHIGGLLGGIVIGFVFYPLLKNNDKSSKNLLALFAITAVTFFVAKTYITSPGNIVNNEQRQEEINALKELSYPDTKEYYEKLNRFAESDSIMVSLIYDTTYNYSGLIASNGTKMEQEIKKASVIISEMKQLNVTEKARKKIMLLELLLNARKEDFESIKRLAEDDGPANRLFRSEIQEREGKLLREIKELK